MAQPSKKDHLKDPLLGCRAKWAKPKNAHDLERLATMFNLSEEDREQLLPSGKRRTLNDRVGWAKSYLKHAGLVRYPKRGYHTDTDAP